jgi:hypothetical protein
MVANCIKMTYAKFKAFCLVVKVKSKAIPVTGREGP